MHPREVTPEAVAGEEVGGVRRKWSRCPGRWGGRGGDEGERVCWGGHTAGAGPSGFARWFSKELQSLCSEPYLTCKSPGPRPAASDPRSGARGLGVCTLRSAARAHTLGSVAQTVSVTRAKRGPRPGARAKCLFLLMVSAKHSNMSSSKLIPYSLVIPPTGHGPLCHPKFTGRCPNPGTSEWGCIRRRAL